MKITEESEISDKQWDEIISVSPFASFFQTKDFYRLFNSVESQSAKVFAIGGENLKALCVVTIQKEKGIKGFFSRRAIIYGGPVINGANEDEFELLLMTIQKKTCRRAIYTEIRNLNSYHDFDRIYHRNKWEYLPYLNYVVDCSDRESFLKKMGNNRKRQIKKAFESGVKIKEANTLEEVVQFYSMVKKFYKKKVGKPLPPKEFFEEFFRKDMGKYLLVTYQNGIIGGILCPVFKEKFIYELYIFGLDDEYKNQSPSVMATWAAIEYAYANKIHYFDFMGAGRKDLDYGVREFKSRFGGQLVEYGRYIKINSIFLYRIGQLAIKIMKIKNK